MLIPVELWTTVNKTRGQGVDLNVDHPFFYYRAVGRSFRGDRLVLYGHVDGSRWNHKPVRFRRKSAKFLLRHGEPRLYVPVGTVVEFRITDDSTDWLATADLSRFRGKIQ